MKALKRNKRKFYYCLYEGNHPIVDGAGNETGETAITYSAPVEMCANISPATGQTNTEQFGNAIDYDKVIVIDDPDFPIDEQSVLFVDVEPYDGQELRQFDYIVKRVARSLNSVSYAIQKVRDGR